MPPNRDDMPTALIDPRATARVQTRRTLQRGALGGLAALVVIAALLLQLEHGTPGPHAESASLARVAAAAPAAAAPLARYADFDGRRQSPEARHVADWVADSRDNAGAEFVILDKRQATLYVFDADARLRGASPVLLGAARGDDSVPGIGARPIADVLPHERTTPAGRFVAERGHNAQGEDVVWVDYDAAVSMHRVRATVAKERRLQRLASKTAADNRISYGCINVPVAFYESFVRPTFATRRAIVYVLPEHKSAAQVFGSYDVAAVRAAWQRLALRS
jgi:hypothetical protein